MTELKYLPSAWLDEYIPDPQENPDDFICQTGEMWFLRPPEDAHDDETYSQRLQHGDIVAFNENRVFGDFVLTVDADGTWSTDFYVPPEANCFRFERDNDTIAQSIEDLISSCEMREGQYDIDAYWWSDYYVPLRFVVEGETAKFVRIEGVASAVPAMQEGGTNG